VKRNIAVVVTINESSVPQMLKSVREMIELAKELNCDVVRPHEAFWEVIRVNKYGVYNYATKNYEPFDHWKDNFDEQEATYKGI